MADQLSLNKTLFQLDISHNSINESNLPYMSAKLSYNHTLYGFHLNGNQMRLDISGMVVEQDKEKKLLQGQFENMDLKSKGSCKPDLRLLGFNWITEKWQ